jgi:hypothetical protein
MHCWDWLQRCVGDDDDSTGHSLWILGELLLLCLAEAQASCSLRTQQAMTTPHVVDDGLVVFAGNGSSKFLTNCG